MMKANFIETIKILDGKIFNLPLHQARMETTMKHHFGSKIFPDLSEIIHVPTEYKSGLVKCRVLYSDSLESIDFQEYSFRRVNRLKLVEDNEIDYRFKAEDRTRINELRASLSVDEDILIVKNGEITDTSFTNVVFQNTFDLYTSSSCLLAGTKRKYLLKNGIIKERKIRVENINEFSKVYLINAMIDLEDEVAVAIDKIDF